MQGPVY